MKRLMLAVVAMLGVANAAVAQISDDVVKIGVLTDMSGGLADLAGPGSVEAARMAVEDFGGTVLGKPIVIVAGDHQNKADVGVSIARQWFDVDKVDVITDVLGTSVALAVQDLTRQKNKVLLVTGGLSDILTDEACSPNSIDWVHDTYATGHDAAEAVVKDGGNSWFFLTADYAFGWQLQRTATAAILAAGGTVLGSVRHPLLSTDMGAYLLQAQSSGAKVIGLASGTDAVSVLKQAPDFGIGPTLDGQRFALLYFSINDAHSLGVKALQGANVVDSFYWNQSDEARAWSMRFFARRKVMPSSIQASNYGAITHYLNAIKAAGTDEPGAVLRQMRATLINGLDVKNGTIRADGRVMRSMYLYAVKTPAESTGDWDLYKPIRTIPADEAFRPAEQSKCYLLKQ